MCLVDVFHMAVTSASCIVTACWPPGSKGKIGHAVSMLCRQVVCSPGGGMPAVTFLSAPCVDDDILPV